MFNMIIIFLKLLLFALFLATPKIGLAQNIYYVDSTIGSDSYSCDQAQNPATPKRTVNGVMSCNPGPGDIVKFRGTFTQTISPTRSGEVLYAFQPIQGVSGSTVTFSNSISGLNPATDFVTIYNSRKGNSGAFAVVNFSGNSVTVDSSDLPLGRFITETAADPGDLHGAILRPVHFTAWDKNNRPVWNAPYQTFYSNGQGVVMVSYLHSISGEDYQVWPALEIDSPSLTACDYLIFDHIEVENAATPLAIEFYAETGFQTNYNIIQHNNFHDFGYQGGVSDEGIYYGNAYRWYYHHDYVQIMYNTIGPHRFTTGVIGDGIEIKPSAHNATIWGNEVLGIVCLECSNAPIKTDGTNTVIGNNYVHDIGPIEYQGCGIEILDDFPAESEGGASGSIVMNNIVENVRKVAIRIMDASNVQVLNNVIYNVPPEPGCDPGDPCSEENGGILVHSWKGPTKNITIKNNIVHSAYIGIGRYIWSSDYPVSIDSDYNLVFNTTYPFRGTITQNTHDLLLDPMFVNPGNGNFHLQSSSPAIDNGTALSDVAIDFDSISRPQGARYDIGAYEYNGTSPSLRAIASGNPTSGPAPLIVNFSGSATGGTPPYSYSWTFGDGDTSTAQNPSHTYSSDNTYTATLTVTDNNSETDSDTVTITVQSVTTAILTLATETGEPAPGPGGTTDPSPGVHSFSIGSTVSIESIPNTHYRFSKWTGDISQSSMFNSTIDLTMNNDKSLSSTFCSKCGDVNGDLQISPGDAQAAFNIFLQINANPTACELENADVNGSGTQMIPDVTPADSQMIFDEYLGRGTFSSDCSGASRTASLSTQTMDFSDVSLTINDIAVSSGQDIFIPIIIESPSEITAFGFDLEFPSNVLTFMGLERTGLTENYDQLDANVLSHQTMNHKTLRVGGYNTDATQIPSSGVLVTLVFRLTGELEYPISLSVKNTYDDIKNATVQHGINYRQNNSLIIEDKRRNKNIKK